MDELVFIQDGHSYVLNGETLPSVTQILKFLSNEIYQDINPSFIEKAAERGTTVHKACETLDKFHETEIDSYYHPYLVGYVSFLKQHKVDWIEIEKQYYHKSKKYAGTIDRFGLIDGHYALVDIKTTSVVKKALVKAQLNGYEDMRKSQGAIPSEVLYCLQLLDTGKYRLYKTAQDMTEFDACYNLFQSLKKKHRRGVIE